MKKHIQLGIFLMLTTGFLSFAGSEKTIENLKSAYNGEYNASVKYAAYADQARKEGLTNIAIMFSATSKAEAIHAENHKKVLSRMGQTVIPIKPAVTVKKTAENLQDAISGETDEMTSLYPRFIATAKSESAMDAVKSFRWAMETEKKHNIIYQNALNALKNNKPNDVPKVYWVCPKCGNTYDVSKPETTCSFCGTKSASYVRFDK